MPGRNNRVQKSQRKNREPIFSGSTDNRPANDACRKDRSISLSSGPDLADIPPYESPLSTSQRRCQTQEQGIAPNQTTLPAALTGLKRERSVQAPVDTPPCQNAIIKTELHTETPIQQQRLPRYYSYDIEPRLLKLTEDYPAINPEYFQQIFENSFKPENLSKLSNSFEKSCLSTKRQVTIGNSTRVVNVESDAQAEDLSSLGFLMRGFEVYRVVLRHVLRVTQITNTDGLDEALVQYMLQLHRYALRDHPFEDIRSLHLAFHKKRAILGIDDPSGWMNRDIDLELEYLGEG